jgi:glycosyltransferase involved in cell wall biosynthesis
LIPGPLKGGHSVRGIGKMVEGQVEAIKRLSDKAIKLDTFDFSTNHNTLITGHYDIVHYPYFFPYSFSLTLPEKKYGKKVVVTIQDLIHLIYPKNYPPGIRGKLNLFKQKQRLKNVDAVITISETSKKDIVRFLNIPADKIHVTYLAGQKFIKKEKDRKKLNLVRKKFNLPEKFALYVGDVNFNKNIPNLIKHAGLPVWCWSLPGNMQWKLRKSVRKCCA